MIHMCTKHTHTHTHTHTHCYAGEAGWGISYFIDGELIPELVVERGRTYTFVIETGEDPEILAEYHPFYITDSISGGRMLLNQQEKANVCAFLFTIVLTSRVVLS